MNQDDRRPAAESQTAQAGAAKPLIIGVGASAGSIESIERFLSYLKLDDDQSIVLVVQHREALDEGRLAPILRRLDGGLLDVRDGMVAEGGKIYLCAPGMISTLQDGVFAVRRAEQEPGERATIDSFLVSLGEERAEEGIGVRLAGTGGDGTLRVATLKDHGGRAIAERIHAPESEHIAESNKP